MNRSGKGISSTYVRVENKKNLTRLLYWAQEGMTKQEIAYQLGMSLPTAIKIVVELKEQGLVTLQSSDLSSGGRIPEIVTFQHNARYAFGLEITGHHIRIALINLKGEPICVTYQKCLFEATTAYWQALAARLLQILDEQQLPREKVIGVGISLPGVVQNGNRLVEFAPTLHLRNYSVEDLSDIFGFPVIVENEANAAGFAEVWMHASPIRDAVYLSINKGVGGAIISDGGISYGQNCRGGEFGHMTLIPYGQECSCGKRGCVEAYCSTRQLSAHSGDQLSTFFEMKPQSPALQRLWEKYLDYLAISISNICVAWDETLILGGEITPYIESDFALLCEKVEKLVPFSSSNPILTLSKTGVDASCIGAALMTVAQYLGLLQA